MQDLLALEDVIPSLPLTIECIASYNVDVKRYRIFVSTKEKHLLIYNLNRTKIDLNIKLERTIKLNKVIEQMGVYEGQGGGLLLASQDQRFHCRDLSSPDIEINAISAKKNVSKFNIITEQFRSSSSDQSESFCQLGLIQKRKLLLYYWDKTKFKTLSEIGLDEVPRAVCWLNFNIVVISSKSGYTAVNITNSSTNGIDIVDRGASPHCVKFGAHSILCSSYSGALMYQDREKLATLSLEFDELPITMTSLYPWFVVSTSVGLLIFAPDHEEATMLQRIPVQSIHSLDTCSDLVFCASTHSLHLLRQTDLQSIISSLHQHRQLKLALSLLKTTTTISPDELNRYKRRINQMQGYEYFCAMEFELAIEKYIESACDPVKVISLFPDLLPATRSPKLTRHPSQPSLSGVQLLDAYRALVPFLTYHRDLLLKAEIRNLDQLKIIDTVLLKTYMHASPSMVASLLRLKENFCMYGECERTLREGGKISELVLLMKKEGKHQAALKLLLESDLTDKVDAINDYLSGSDISFDVALTFGRSIIRTHPEVALAMFTADTEAEKWPREKVYELFKETKSPGDMVISLIEHYVNVWNDKSAETLHWLILEYRQNIVDLRNAMLAQVEQDNDKHRNGPSIYTLTAVDDLNKARAKLIAVLESNENYNPDQVLTHFESGDWIEEKTCLLARLGRHKQALYVYAEGMPERALVYCGKVAKRCPAIYSYLLEYYIENDQLERILELLALNEVNLPVEKTLSLVPPDIELATVSRFIEKSIQKTAQTKRSLKMESALLELESFRIDSERVKAENKSVQLDTESRCSHCGRTINPSGAIAITPQGEIYHYGCLNVT